MSACRPRQWTKNIVLAIPPAAAGVLGSPATLERLAAAIAAFSLAASATYLINDVCDRDEDRLHPRKRHRPIAAGELSESGALHLAWVLAAGGVGVGLLTRPLVALVICTYLALTGSYSLWWRHVAIADVAAIAAGFLLRALAGGAAAGVRLSTSFLVVTCACALFLVLGKRYAEAAAPRPRRTLRIYGAERLRALLLVSALTAVGAYAYWAFGRSQPNFFAELSLVPFVLWLGRYAGRLDSGQADAPEELIFGDPVLLALAGGWGVLFLMGVYAAG